jgi:hypothetical protein
VIDHIEAGRARFTAEPQASPGFRAVLMSIGGIK